LAVTATTLRRANGGARSGDADAAVAQTGRTPVAIAHPPNGWCDETGAPSHFGLGKLVGVVIVVSHTSLACGVLGQARRRAARRPSPPVLDARADRAQPIHSFRYKNV